MNFFHRCRMYESALRWAFMNAFHSTLKKARAEMFPRKENSFVKIAKIAEKSHIHSPQELRNGSGKKVCWEFFSSFFSIRKDCATVLERKLAKSGWISWDFLASRVSVQFWTGTNQFIFIARWAWHGAFEEMSVIDITLRKHCSDSWKVLRKAINQSFCYRSSDITVWIRQPHQLMFHWSKCCKQNLRGNFSGVHPQNIAGTFVLKN